MHGVSRQVVSQDRFHCTSNGNMEMPSYIMVMVDQLLSRNCALLDILSNQVKILPVYYIDHLLIRTTF